MDTGTLYGAERLHEKGQNSNIIQYSMFTIQYSILPHYLIALTGTLSMSP